MKALRLYEPLSMEPEEWYSFGHANERANFYTRLWGEYYTTTCIEGKWYVVFPK